MSKVDCRKFRATIGEITQKREQNVRKEQQRSPKWRRIRDIATRERELKLKIIKGKWQINHTWEAVARSQSDKVQTHGAVAHHSEIGRQRVLSEVSVVRDG